MHSTHNEGKSVGAERFIKTLKNKIYKHMTYVGKNVYFNVLDDILRKYNSSDICSFIAHLYTTLTLYPTTIGHILIYSPPILQ